MPSCYYDRNHKPSDNTYHCNMLVITTLQLAIDWFKKKEKKSKHKTLHTCRFAMKFFVHVFICQKQR